LYIIKRILLLLAAVPPIFVSAQKLSVGLFTSFDYTSPIEVSFEKPGFGMQLGPKFKFDLGKNISFLSGFVYQNHTINFDFTEVQFIVAPTEQPINSRHTWHIMQIPMQASFYFGNKVKFGASLGWALNYVYRNTGAATFKNVSSGEKTTRTYTNSNDVAFISGLFSFGVEYNWEHFAIRVEPNLGYSLAELKRNNTDVYHLGVGLTAFYNLGR
jgi:hypothetical protein